MIKHMNANPITPVKLKMLKHSDSTVVEEKFEGNRTFLYLSNDGNKTVSRGNHDNSHRAPHVVGVKWRTCGEILGPTILDGEMHTYRLRDVEISGQLNYRGEGPCDEDIIFKAFDCVMYNNKILTAYPLSERRKYLEQAVFEVDSPNVIIVPQFELSDIDDPKDYFDEVVGRGGEGIMLKDSRSFYHSGKRPENVWYKWKKKDTWDVICIGFKAGIGKHLGRLGSIEIGVYKDGKIKSLGYASGKLTDYERTTIWFNQDDYLGRVLEVEAMDRYKVGTFKEARFIRWRDDKSKEECVWTK